MKKVVKSEIIEGFLITMRNTREAEISKTAINIDRIGNRNAT